MSIKIALAGNPNCGKTTLFNALTGSNQFVGNWPGVTVEKKEGKLKGHDDVTIMDLPGIYSLSPYTLEEVVARNYLINERPDAILNIVDGTNIERNLYLSTQIMELGIPVVMAVNMIDIMEKTGNKVHIDKLSKKLGCEVVEISALKGTGIKEAANKSDKAIYVCSKFMKQTMAFFTEQEKELSRELFSFHPKFYSQRLLRSIKRNGMVMITGSSQKNHIKEIIKELPQEETLLIYSLWDGYYKNLEQIKENPVYKEFREMFYNVVDIHTSGHADRKTIEKVIRTINPKKTICIHKEADAEL